MSELLSFEVWSQSLHHTFYHASLIYRNSGSSLSIVISRSYMNIDLRTLQYADRLKETKTIKEILTTTGRSRNRCHYGNQK
jgi:hypothetical protein